MVRAVLESSGSRGAARLVLIAIADRAGDDGCGAFLSNVQLQRDAAVDERTVRRALRALERLGELVVEGRARNGANAYRVQLAPAATPGNMPPGQYAPPGQAPGRGGRSARAPRAMCPPLLNDQNDQEQDQDHRPAAPSGPHVHRLLVKLAHVVLDDVEAGRLHIAAAHRDLDLRDELKLRAGRARIVYGDSRVVAKALDAAQAQRVARRVS
jgi:hypothetical protein